METYPIDRNSTNKFIIPSASDIANARNPNHAEYRHIVTVLTHNVADLLPSLNADQRKQVVEHYYARAMHQLLVSGPGDVVAIPSGRYIPELTKLIVYMANQTGVHAVMVADRSPIEEPIQPSQSIETKAKNIKDRVNGMFQKVRRSVNTHNETKTDQHGLSEKQRRNLISDMRAAGTHDANPRTTTFASDVEVVHMPYFTGTMGNEQLVVGPVPEHADGLKNKRTFHELLNTHRDILQQTAARNGIEGSVVLPYRISTGVNPTLDTVAQRLQETRALQQRALQSLSNGETTIPREKQKNLIDKIRNYGSGVVIRMTQGDGGYGTIFYDEKADGTYALTVDKHKHEYADREEAWAKLREYLTASGENVEYIVTRKIDISSSPSNGTYFSGDEIRTMPPTIQFMNNGSCVGGGSYTAENDQAREIYMNKAGAIQELSATLTHLSTTEVINGQRAGQHEGHIGYDFIIAGEKEDALREAVYADAALKNDYGTEVTEITLAEANPRLTSLSLSVLPLIRHLQLQRPDIIGPKLTSDHLAMMYGERINGMAGGFAVWDYFKVKPNVVDIQTLISNVIEPFNAKYAEYGIFMMPRILVEKGNAQEGEEQYNMTSVVVALTPTENPENEVVFQRVVKELSEHGGLNGFTSL